jgi:uncharacterized membrane protein
VLVKVRTHWYDLMQSLWFLPGLVTLAFAALAMLVVQVDRMAGSEGIGVLFGGSPEAAREILSTIAGSVITVAGLAFSITIITLQLVSQQFSPRATRTFLGNKPTQVSAGVFLGVFVYCLLVLRSVREEDFGEFVPGLAVALAILLGVLGIGVLLFFINHTAQSIKVTSIAARIARETLSSIDQLYPEAYGEPAGGESGVEEIVARWREEGEPLLVRPQRPGFVERIGLDTFVERLPDRARRVYVQVMPGEFVTEEQPLMSVWPCDGLDADALEEAGRTAVLVGSEREVREDIAYGIQQLADIALRAISPSVNDPTTAVTCVGYIAAILERLAGRSFPAALRRYRDGSVEVVAVRPAFELYVSHGIDDVGRWSAEYPRVTKALLSAVGRAAAVAAEEGAADRVDALLAAAERITGTALDGAPTDQDRAELEQGLEDVRRSARERSVERRLAVGAHRPWSGRDS